MKNQYFGDESDYRKYGILRAIATSGGLHVGVCWMLTPDDGRTDGDFTAYLGRPGRWRSHDPELFDALQEAVSGEVARGVAAADTLDLVPGATYFDPLVPSDAAKRSAWFGEALTSLRGPELVFFDPDNGFEVASAPLGRKGSEKYVLWHEVAATYRAGKSVMVFQYYPRRSRAAFHAELTVAARDRTSATDVRILRTNRVAYLLIVQPLHGQAIDASVAALEKRWSNQVWIADVGV